jgi:tryptophan-rich sensory protein
MLKDEGPMMTMNNSMTIRKAAYLAACIAICQIAGVIGSVFTSSSVATWYPTLVKPWFAPPGYVIAAVWIVLFTFMGISVFMIWQESRSSIHSLAGNRTGNKMALAIFAVQLLVNILWSYAFFGLRSPLAGLAVIVVLWFLILQCIIVFWSIRRNAALLLVPYLLWVSFAAFINYSIWKLNS